MRKRYGEGEGKVREGSERGGEREKLSSHSTFLQGQRVHSSPFSQVLIKAPLPLSLVAALLQALPALSQTSLVFLCPLLS